MNAPLIAVGVEPDALSLPDRPAAKQPGVRGTVVVADDDATTRAILSRILTREQYRVIDAENGQLACDVARSVEVDLILLDWSMPVMDGLTALKMVRSDAATRAIPVVMLTTLSQIDDKLLALEAGAQDFLIKPCHPRELIARIQQQRRWHELLTADPSAIAMERRAATVEIHVQEKLRIAAEIERLRETATRDALTGLPNRSLLLDHIDRTILSSRQRHEHFATYFIDLDGFKEVNDTYGHLAGDEVLRAVATRIRSVLRESDIVARMGGDEFVVIAPKILTPQNARDIAERLVEATSAPIALGATNVRVSTSVGVSFFPIDATDRFRLLECADAAMYFSKRAGRNRFTFTSDAVFSDARIWELAFACDRAVDGRNTSAQV